MAAKSPATPRKAKSAVSGGKTARGIALPIVAAPSGQILGGQKADYSKKYDINTRGPDPNGFYALYNHDAPAGARLVKGGDFPLSRESPGAVQPHTFSEPWTHYRTREEADDAAIILQTHLDKWETKNTAK